MVFIDFLGFSLMMTWTYWMNFKFLTMVIDIYISFFFFGYNTFLPEAQGCFLTLKMKDLVMVTFKDLATFQKAAICIVGG